MRSVLIIIVIVLFTSCEAITGGGGKVLDEKGRPIENAKIDLLIDGEYAGSVMSKSDGKFSIGEIRGCAFNCPESILIFTKNGYKALRCEVDKELSKNPEFDFENIYVVMQSHR